MHYLAARDAVALGGIAQAGDAARWATQGNGFSFGSPEMRRFWFLAALVEVGRVDLVKGYLEERALKDNRLNLALHLGCFFLEKVRAASRKDKSDAAEISKMLAPKIAFHQALLAKEFRGQLLELQRGKIVELDEIEFDESEEK
jgi:hypothetical protein